MRIFAVSFRLHTSAGERLYDPDDTATRTRAVRGGLRSAPCTLLPQHIPTNIWAVIITSPLFYAAHRTYRALPLTRYLAPHLTRVPLKPRVFSLNYCAARARQLTSAFRSRRAGGTPWRRMTGWRADLRTSFGTARISHGTHAWRIVNVRVLATSNLLSVAGVFCLL